MGYYRSRRRRRTYAYDVSTKGAAVLSDAQKEKALKSLVVARGAANAEFVMRVVLPMLSSSRVANILANKKVVGSGLTKHKRRVTPAVFTNHCGLSSSPSTFFIYFARALYKTTAVQEALVRHMYAAAVGCARTVLKGGEDEETLMRIAAATVSDVQEGFACIDSLFLDLTRMLATGESPIPSEQHPVLYKILQRFYSTPIWPELVKQCAGDIGLSATTALYLLMQQGAQDCTRSSSSEAKQERSQEQGNIEDMIDAANVESFDAQAFNSSVWSAKSFMEGRAKACGVATGNTASQQSEVETKIDDIADSLSNEESDKPDSHTQTGHTMGGGKQRGTSGNPHEFSLEQLNSALATFRRLVSRSTSGTKNLDYYDSVGGAITNYDAIEQVFKACGRIEGYMVEALSHSKYGDGEVVDVDCGNSLHNILPNELIKLAMPELRPLFMTQFAEETLLVHTRKGAGESGAGPIICLVDLSGSMATSTTLPASAGIDQSKPISVPLGAVAQAFALCLARYASTWGRKCVIIPFNHDVYPNKAVRAGIDSKNEVRHSVRTLCGLRPSGGTTFQRALEEAARQITTVLDDSEFDYADIVMFTDGEGEVDCHCPEHLKSVDTWRDDYAVTEALNRSRDDIRKRVKMPDGVRMFSFLLSEDKDDNSARMTEYNGRQVRCGYDSLGVPYPHNKHDCDEHDNMHWFDVVVKTPTDGRSLKRGITRFFTELIRGAFYRE